MLLGLKDLHKSYTTREDRVDALRGVSIDVAAGEFVAVQGPSGCGKSTLLLTAGGLMQPDQGSVSLEDAQVYELDAEERAALRSRRLGFVFQQFHLIPYLSVEDNVHAAALALGQEASRQEVDELLQRFGLTDRRTHVPSELSTGEKQRTALARALLNKPALLLADEPTGNLDRENATVVLEHLRAFTQDGGAVLLVTHDPHAASYATRSVHMEHGLVVSDRAVESGSP